MMEVFFFTITPSSTPPPTPAPSHTVHTPALSCGSKTRSLSHRHQSEHRATRRQRVWSRQTPPQPTHPSTHTHITPNALFDSPQTTSHHNSNSPQKPSSLHSSSSSPLSSLPTKLLSLIFPNTLNESNPLWIWLMYFGETSCVDLNSS